MDIQTIALVATGLWLFVLTALVLLLVRQLGLITLRLEAWSDDDPVVPREGPDVGTALSSTVLNSVPSLRSNVSYLLLISPTCRPCHELAPELEEVSGTSRVVALVPGSPALADSFVQLLPRDYEVIRDPAATELANALDLDRTPFVLEIEDGVVTGRAQLFAAADFKRLIDARSESNAAEIAALVREGRSHAVA